MRLIYSLIFTLLSITLTAQTVDCGKRTDKQSFTLDAEMARGDVFDISNKHYGAKVRFQGAIDFQNEQGYSQTRDTLYYVGRQEACYIDVGDKRYFTHPCAYNLDDLYESIVQRPVLAAIPAPPVSSSECPDSIYRGAHLWYDGDGNAVYQYYGVTVSYSNPIDTVQDIVESKIKVKDCVNFKKNETIKTRNKRKNIVLRRGYCSDAVTNKNDQIEILRGEVLEYKGVKLRGDTITFRNNRNFKIVFAPGTIKLRKTDSGGKMEFISNVQWN